MKANHIKLAKENSKINQAQLAIDWYLNPEVYALEQKHLFSQAPNYFGHKLMTPESGDYFAIPWLDNAKILINDKQQIQVLSNICRHRQAVMLEGKGNTSHIICPLHRWTYDTNGSLLGAPHFKENPCLHLNKTNLTEWNGLLFETSEQRCNVAQALKNLGCLQDFDFTNYHFDKVEITHYNFNWKTFIETYLEDYHVGPFHPGLNQFVNCKALQWEFGDDYSVQTVGYKHIPDASLSKVYQTWQQAVELYHGDTKPKYGAIWFVLYPFLMIEWYPNVLVVSHLKPTGVDACKNIVEFYYPEDIALFEREYIKAQQAAYAETAIEDKEICDRMQHGRAALYKNGLDERGPYQHPMETGLEHFHAWYRRKLEKYLPHQ